MSTAEVFPPERNPADTLPEALESRLAALTETVARLEARVSRLESPLPEQKVSLESALSSAAAPSAACPIPCASWGSWAGPA